MVDIDPVPLVASPADITPIEAKAQALDRTHVIRQCALRYPICGVEECYQGVRSSRRQVFSRGRELEGCCRGGVGVEGVEDGKGGEIADFDGTVAGGEEDMPRGRGLGEDYLVDLMVLTVLTVRGTESEVWEGDGQEDVILDLLSMIVTLIYGRFARNGNGGWPMGMVLERRETIYVNSEETYF